MTVLQWNSPQLILQISGGVVGFTIKNSLYRAHCRLQNRWPYRPSSSPSAALHWKRKPLLHSFACRYIAPFCIRKLKYYLVHTRPKFERADFAAVVVRGRGMLLLIIATILNQFLWSSTVSSPSLSLFLPLSHSHTQSWINIVQNT